MPHRATLGFQPRRKGFEHLRDIQAAIRHRIRVFRHGLVGHARHGVRVHACLAQIILQAPPGGRHFLHAAKAELRQILQHEARVRPAAEQHEGIAHHHR